MRGALAADAAWRAREELPQPRENSRKVRPRAARGSRRPGSGVAECPPEHPLEQCRRGEPPGLASRGATSRSAAERARRPREHSVLGRRPARGAERSVTARRHGEREPRDAGAGGCGGREPARKASRSAPTDPVTRASHHRPADAQARRGLSPGSSPTTSPATGVLQPLSRVGGNSHVGVEP